jgi:hypothetical protein
MVGALLSGASSGRLRWKAVILWALGTFLFAYSYVDALMNGIQMGVHATIAGYQPLATAHSLDSFGAYLDLSMRSGLPFSGIALVLGGLTRRELGKRARVNEGIRRSAINALVAPVIIFTVVVLFVLAGAWISRSVQHPTLNAAAQNARGSHLRTSGLGPLLSLWATLAMPFGGFACLKHYILRLCLAATGDMPLHTRRFLDYAADRLLVQKVGGGYVFVHRLLLEHLAQIGKDASP